mgnify:FL=1
MALYDVETREWGSSTSQGKDLRDVTYANFFPVGMGRNFAINANSTVEQYSHIQAISVGLGTTYSLELNQKEVESCPQKYEIFRTISIWEKARSANAFPRNIKKLLVDPKRNWILEQGENEDSWILNEVKEDKEKIQFILHRNDNYSAT